MSQDDIKMILKVGWDGLNMLRDIWKIGHGVVVW
jgi:hypothetical protein